MATVVFDTRPPAEAAAYLEGKSVGGRFSFDWRDVWQEEHSASFVVAKAMSADILADIHGGLVKAMNEGWTQERFIQELTPLLQAKGWWGKKPVTDPVTGATELATLGTPRRLRVIYDTNMRMALSAGRWERFSRSAQTRPYLKYHHTEQPNPRKHHLAWHGILLPITHDFWKTHWCPNGWGCKCFVTSHRIAEAVTSEDELQRRGVYDQVAWTNKRTGQTQMVPKGVDVGFGYNVGQARLAAMAPPAMPEPQRPYVQAERMPRALPPALAARALPADVAVHPNLAGDPQAVFEAMAQVLGSGEGQIYTDRAQVPIVLSQRMFEEHDAAGDSVGPKAGLASRAPLAQIFAAVMRDPDEIWHSLQLRADGTSVYVRNLVAAFDVPEAGRQWFVVTFHEGSKRGVWMGATAYGPGNVNRPGSQASATAKGHRVGTLVYRRK